MTRVQFILMTLGFMIVGGLVGAFVAWVFGQW